MHGIGMRMWAKFLSFCHNSTRSPDGRTDRQTDRKALQ